PSGITAPGLATATVCPAATLGAPQTIVTGPPLPMSTWQTRRRSASGCCSASSTLPTTNFSSAATPWRSTRSTSVPVMARRSASACASISGAQYSCSHSSGTRISRHLRVRRSPSAELLQEADVVVVEQAQIGNPVLEHGDPFHTHAEGEALNLLWVVAVVPHVLEHIRIDHPGAQDLDPCRALAQRAALAVSRDAVGAVEAGHVDLDARLREREEVRTHSHLSLLTEDGAGEREQRPLEVAQGDVLVDRQSFDLMELWRVRSVGVGPVHASGHDDVDRRRLALHGAYLDR